MQTIKTLDQWTSSDDRRRARRTVGANLIVFGALGALAAVALLILVTDAGGPASKSNSPGASTAVVDTPAPRATSSADQGRSWLCDIGSDDSAPEVRVAAAESLARGEITCAPGQTLGPQTAAAD